MSIEGAPRNESPENPLPAPGVRSRVLETPQETPEDPADREVLEELARARRGTLEYRVTNSV